MKRKNYSKKDRASDKNSLTGFDRPSFRAREEIEDDEECLVMRLTCLHLCLNELTIREFEKIEQHKIFQRNSDKIHRATHEDAYARASFDYCPSVFPQFVRKAGSDVDPCNVSTCWCSILFNNVDSFNRKE